MGALARAALGLFLATPALTAAGGTVLRVSTVLEGIDMVDIAADSRDRSFWVLGFSGNTEASHRIYHLASDLGALLGSLDNPHPSGVFPDLTTNRGIAYRSLSRTLFVLSSVGPRTAQRLEVREVDPATGTEVPGGFFQVAVPAGSSLFGLTYDLFERHFWSLDTQNDRVVRIATDGTIAASVLLPGKDFPETVLRGQGVAFSLVGVDPRLSVAYGDIFRSGPDRILGLTVGGTATGIEVPLVGVPSSSLRGFDLYQIGQQRRAAVVDASGRIYELEQVIPDPVPPSDVRCVLNRTNQVEISWQNHGTGLNGAYAEIQLLRNGVPFQSLPGDSVSFTDTTPSSGTSTYELRAAGASGGPFGDANLGCRVTVGSGGLVDWQPLPGFGPFDVTRHPATGEVYVTDATDGRIWILDGELQRIGEIPSPWSRPGGITHVPAIHVGFPPPGTLFSDVLAVLEAGGTRLRLWELANPLGPDGGTTITLQTPGISTPSLTSLSFEPATESFLALEESTGSLLRFDKNGNFVSSCQPSAIQVSEELDRGVTYDPIQETVLAVFRDGLVRELFVPPTGTTCPRPASEFGFSLESTGEGFDTSGFAGGIQIDGNTLLVCGRRSRAIFRVLIFPFAPPFIRGDFNADTAVNATDAVNLTHYLFRQGATPPCQDAADVNDDGILDVADPVYLLFWLFVANTPPPPAPYPEAGDDPTFRDNLGCAQ